MDVEKDGYSSDQQQASEGRIKQMQATLNRKDSLINSLRNKVNELSGLAVQKVSLGDDLEKHVKVVQRMKLEVHKKEMELDTCRQQLQKVVISGCGNIANGKLIEPELH